MANKKIISNIAKILCATMGVCAVAAPLTACNGSKLSNEKTPLVLATDVLDGVFNPFFYTSGTDGEIVSQTQIGMLSGDKNAQPVANWNEPCVAHDFSVVTTGTQNNKIPGEQGDEAYKNYYTDYYFALKNNIVFSDGEPLTKEDVLFNMYMYLDPAYTGSSTMYSVSIKGLDAYRTQSDNAAEAENAQAYYDGITQERVNLVLEWADDDDTTWDDIEQYEYYILAGKDDTPENRVFRSDLETVHTLFKEDVKSSWTSAMAVDVAKDYEKYKDKNGNLCLTEHWEVFLYYYGEINLVRTPMPGNPNEIYYERTNNYTGTEADKGEKTEENLTNYIYNKFFGTYNSTTPSGVKNYKNKLAEAIRNYVGSAFRLNVRSDVISRELHSEGGLRVKSVSGIEVIQGDSIPVDTNGGTRALKNAAGEPGTFDILHITINGVDPKAIQNFSFTVAPGHYYSSTWDQVKVGYGKAEANPYFGVEYADNAFMRAIKEKQLPLGAGAYKAADGDSGNIATSKDQFFKDNNVYFVRNESFMLGVPKIKYLHYQVVNSNMLYDTVKAGTVHYASPSMDYEHLLQLQGKDKDVLDSEYSDNLGYGYIGINASFVKNIWVRRAIMSTFDPQMCVDYYGEGNASIIRRPMSKTLTDYYDDEKFQVCDDYSYYPYGGKTFDEVSGLSAEEKREKAKEIALEYATVYGKCTPRSDGILVDPNRNNQPLKYTFTVAGATDDHPAYRMLQNSVDILNSIGFDITLSQDSTALVKLASGRLQVWAAAWSSSSDPDMYQVYHKDSTATSTLAWGYPHLKSSESSQNERDMLEDLANDIESAREYTKVEDRKPYYMSALNKLMWLAVEFPTYQRSVYYVWRTGLFDDETIKRDEEVTAYQSPLSRIWEVSFNEG